MLTSISHFGNLLDMTRFEFSLEYKFRESISTRQDCPRPILGRHGPWYFKANLPKLAAGVVSDV